MISTNVPPIGASGVTGIYSSGSGVIGTSSAGRLVIDLTSTSLHPRVTYQGPAHYYRNADGLLVLSAENDWPLEYIDGVAAGRHEPEPAAENYQGSSLISSLSSDFVATSTAVAGSVTGPTGADVVSLRSDFLKTALYGNSSWLVAEYYPGITDQYQRVIMSSELASVAQVRTYIGRWDSSNYCYALSQEIPAGPVTASLYRAQSNSTSGVGVSLVSVEVGNLVTSPIITMTGQTATRLASSVTINTSGYASIVITFNDDSEVSLATTGSTTMLPVATEHWGTRFIEKILLER